MPQKNTHTAEKDIEKEAVRLVWKGQILKTSFEGKERKTVTESERDQFHICAAEKLLLVFTAWRVLKVSVGRWEENSRFVQQRSRRHDYHACDPHVTVRIGIFCMYCTASLSVYICLNATHILQALVSLFLFVSRYVTNWPPPPPFGDCRSMRTDVV